RPQLTLRQMFAANPRAVLGHVAWNVSLVPNGLQVLLFNAASGSRNPDYPAPHLNRRFPLYFTLICAAVWIVASFLLVKERRFWWEFWLRERALTWLAMLAVAAVAFTVIPTQRPRPSYLFSLGVFLMAVTAMGAFVILHRLRQFAPVAKLMPALMLGLCFT